MRLTRLRRVKGLLFAVVCISLLSLFLLIGCKPKPNSDDSLQNITDVSVNDKYIYYDGDFHGLDIIGLHDDDVVSYATSADGVFYLSKPLYKDIGYYNIYIKIERDGCRELVLSATLSISLRVLDGITCSDARVEYDGLPHNIPVAGVRDGDDITYSLDGETFSSDPNITGVGVYTVYLCVKRGFAEYRDSAVLTILPSISGTYFNPTHGSICISNFATSDGLPVSYDMSCSGVIGNKPFSFATDRIILDGIEYDRLDSGVSVYSVSVNGSTALYFSQSANINVSINDFSAVVSVGSTALSFAGFNYCESINSVTNNGLSCGMSFHATSNVSIILSTRAQTQFEAPSSIYVYDGASHSLPVIENMLYEVDGQLVSTPPSFSEIGTYYVNVLYLKQGFLPIHGVAAIAIAPSPDGDYFSIQNKVIISIKDCAATKNGSPALLEYIDGRWIVDEVPLSEYSARSSETLFAIYIDGIISDISVELTDAKYIGVQGTNVSFFDNLLTSICSFSLSGDFGSVSVNGSTLTPLSLSPLPEYDVFFGVGLNDADLISGIVIIEFFAQ